MQGRGHRLVPPRWAVRQEQVPLAAHIWRSPTTQQGLRGQPVPVAHCQVQRCKAQRCWRVHVSAWWTLLSGSLSRVLVAVSHLLLTGLAGPLD